ncbi:MAG: response regulator [Acidobacteria bacterium]|nr:MAG: response regulator [Acidobacteriota bacterium]
MAKRILLIDDDPKILTLEKTILTQGGFSVDMAQDGPEGLTKLKASKYDAIVLDVMMPVMDGYEVARQIKQLDSYKEVPIVMVTAATERDAMKQGFTSGAMVFMSKPFTAAKLLSAIQTVTK